MALVTPIKSVTPPRVADGYDLKDLLKDATASKASDFFKANPPTPAAIESFFEDVLNSSNKTPAKKSSALEAVILYNDCLSVHCVKNWETLIRLREKNLISSDFLKIFLKKHEDLQVALQQKFTNICEQSNFNKAFIAFCIDAGLKYNINKIAKTGNYSLLKEFQDRGVDILEAVFQLVEFGEDRPLKNLLENRYDIINRLDPNIKNKKGNTLLVEAVNLDQDKIVEVLLANGANPLICDGNNRTVFDLAKEKKPRIRKLLYDPTQINSSLGTTKGWNNDPSLEERALERFLNMKAGGTPYSKYYCLLIKVKNVALALLKSSCFPKTMRQSEGEFTAYRPLDPIRCWAPRTQYSIPAEFIPPPTNMGTIGFAIIKAGGRDQKEGVVDVNKQKYICIPLTSNYTTPDPDKEHGFKYSYGDVQTHGHGVNPEAARSAFKERKDGVKLKHWTTIPNLKSDHETLAKFSDEFNQMFKKEEENSKKLDELDLKICHFLEDAESLIEARYNTPSNAQKKLEENRHIQQIHGETEISLRDARLFVFDEKRLGEWQFAIQKQISSLQELEQKLQSAKPMAASIFDNERELVSRNLNEIKSLITNRSVTSSETPTFKVYTSSPLIEDIFAHSAGSIAKIKRAVCRLIGLSLKNITFVINETLASRFLDADFRKRMINQLKTEAQAVINCAQLRNDRKMQELASHLALLEDTSAMITIIPPIHLAFDQRNGKDRVFEDIMKKHLNIYVSAQEILNGFWFEICQDEEFFETHLDQNLELVTQRVLLMDEAIREKEGDHFHYPLMDSRHPKRILDEQLLVLLTSFLFVLDNDVSSEKTTLIQKIAEFVKIKLPPSLHGVEKKENKIEGLILLSVLDVIPKIKSLIEAAWLFNPSDDSPFKTLNDLLGNYSPPKKSAIEGLCLEYFETFSNNGSSPSLNPLIAELIATTQKMKDEIERLITSHGVAAGHDSSSTVKTANEHLGTISRAFDYLKMEKSEEQNILEELLKMTRGGKTITEDDIMRASSSQLTNKINASISALQQSMKNFHNLDKIEINRAKSLQIELTNCIKSIEEYLKIEQKNTPENFESCRIASLKMLGSIREADKSLEKSLNQIPIVYEYLQETVISDNIEMVLLVGKIADQIKNHLKKKKTPGPSFPLVGQLFETIRPYLNIILPTLLKDLLQPLRECQASLSATYVKKLQEMSKELSLGIREQNYFTTQNKNLTYYLWDGKPRKALPYHTANEVHIPLDDDQDLLSRNNRYEGLSVTRARGFSLTPK